MGNTYTIRIRSGSNSVKRYRFSMWWKRYIFNPRSNGRGFYEKKDCSKWEKNKMFHFCRRRKLSLISIHAPAKGATAHFYNFYFHMRSTFVYHAQCNKFTIYISNIKYSYIVRNYCAVPPHFHVRQTYAQLFITTKVLPLQCFFSFQKYQSYFYKNSLIDKI